MYFRGAKNTRENIFSKSRGNVFFFVVVVIGGEPKFRLQYVFVGSGIVIPLLRCLAPDHPIRDVVDVTAEAVNRPIRIEHQLCLKLTRSTSFPVTMQTAFLFYLGVNMLLPRPNSWKQRSRKKYISVRRCWQGQ